MKRSLLASALTLVAYFGFGQCGPYSLNAPAQSCVSSPYVLTVSGASAASEIIWKKNGITFNTSVTNTAITVAGGNGQGNAANQLYSPRGIYLDSAGNIYVADQQNDRIQKFPSGSTSADSAITLGSGIEVFSVFVDKSDTVYAADFGNSYIDKFAPGSTSAIIAAGINGFGYYPEQLNSPFGVYLDRSGNIYVADAFNSRIEEFPAGSMSGTAAVTVAGSYGNTTGPTGLNIPSSVFVDSAGNVYVADAGNNRIQMFPAGSTSSTYGITVAGGNDTGTAANQLNSPAGIYLDKTGNIYVADRNNNRIQKFPAGSSSATNGITVAGGHGVGSASNQLNQPWGVYVDDAGNIYVGDAGNDRIQKWSQSAGPYVDTSIIISSPGSYSAIIVGASGCIVASDTINININSGSSISQSICQGNSYSFSGNNLSIGGIYLDTFTAVSGCDSIVTLTLSIYPSATNTITHAICPGSGYTLGTNTYTVSGIYTDTLMGAAMYGCDSIVTLDLLVLDSTTSYFYLQPSDSAHVWYIILPNADNNITYVWNWGDSTTSTGDTASHTYAAAGSYNICLTVIDSAGCSVSYCDTSVYLFKNQSGQMIYVEVLPQYPSGINTINTDNLNINYYSGAVHFSESLQAPTELKLYDLSGRVVMQQDNFAGNTWNINPGIAQGVYIIHLQSGAYSTAKKLMIMQ